MFIWWMKMKDPKDEKERWIKKNEIRINKCLYNEWKWKIQKMKKEREKRRMK